MPQYIVRGELNGQAMKAKVEGESETHARERAERKGMTVTSVEPVAVPATPQPSVSPTPPVKPQPPAQPQPVQVAVQPVQPTGHAHDPIHIHTPNRRNGAAFGLGIAAIILGVIALLVCWIPLVNIISVPIAGLGLLLALIGGFFALTTKFRGIGMPIAGAVTCIVAISGFVIVNILFAAAVGGAAQSASTALEEIGQELEAERQAAEQARQDAKAASREVLGVTINSVSPAEFSDARIIYTITNESGRDINGFRGAIVITDQFGENQARLTLDFDDPLAADTDRAGDGNYSFWSSPGLGESLMNSFSTYTFTVEADSVIYGDGTRENY